MCKKINQKGFTLIEILIIGTFLLAVSISMFRFFVPTKKLTQANSNKSTAVNLAQEVINNIKTWEYDEITLENIYKNCTKWEVGDPIPLSIPNPISEQIIIIRESKKIGVPLPDTGIFISEKKATKNIYFTLNATNLKKLIKVEIIWQEGIIVQEGRPNQDRILRVEVIQVFK
ncbi:MAG: type II secretion system protein [bacterium]